MEGVYDQNQDHFDNDHSFEIEIEEQEEEESWEPEENIYKWGTDFEETESILDVEEVEGQIYI